MNEGPSKSTAFSRWRRRPLDQISLYGIYLRDSKEDSVKQSLLKK